MPDETCYLCDSSDAEVGGRPDFRMVDCKNCGRYRTTITFAENTIRTHTDRLLAAGSLWHYWDDHKRIHGKRIPVAKHWPRVDSQESLYLLIAEAPQSPHEKAKHLLRDAVEKNKEFGERVNYKKFDGPICYAKSYGELKSFARHLESLGLVSGTSFSNTSSSFIVTAAGFDHENSNTQPLTIFLSSTVYDLSDLRAELAEHLESAGHVVRMSEDFERFKVDQQSNSIQQCLNNIDASEVVICLVDQRYGGVVEENGNEDWNGKSPTQIEFEYAHKKKDLPVYAFVRDKAELDAGLLRKNIETKTQWVEARGKDEIKEKWLAFYEELTKLKSDPQKPNWFDPFRTSVDLKKLVGKRLADFAEWKKKRTVKG